MRGSEHATVNVLFHLAFKTAITMQGAWNALYDISLRDSLWRGCRAHKYDRRYFMAVAGNFLAGRRTGGRGAGAAADLQAASYAACQPHCQPLDFHAPDEPANGPQHRYRGLALPAPSDARYIGRARCGLHARVLWPAVRQGRRAATPDRFHACQSAGRIAG